MECSAKSGESIAEVFMTLGRLMKERFIDEGSKEGISAKEKGEKVGLVQSGRKKCC